MVISNINDYKIILNNLNIEHLFCTLILTYLTFIHIYYITKVNMLIYIELNIVLNTNIAGAVSGV